MFKRFGNYYFPWLKVICNFPIEDKKGNELKFNLVLLIIPYQN